MKVLVIGDSCTDIFIYGEIERISPEAPVPVFKPISKTKNGGMAKNVLANLKALGVGADIITNTNDIRKIRYVDNRSNQMVLRVDENDKCNQIDEGIRMNICNNYYMNKYYNAIVISDYCKGFLDTTDIELICKSNKNVFVDTKKMLGAWITNASFIKINHLEHQKNFETLPNYPELKNKLIITQGKNGCIYMGNRFDVDEVPVKDVSGAGDTFISGLVVEYLKTNDIKKAIKFAQDCTTTVVQKHGVTTVK